MDRQRQDNREVRTQSRATLVSSVVHGHAGGTRLRWRPPRRGPIYPCRDVVGSLRHLAGVQRPRPAAPGNTLVRHCARLARTGRVASLVSTRHEMSPIAAYRRRCEGGGRRVRPQHAHRRHMDRSTTAPCGVRRFVRRTRRCAGASATAA